MMTIKTRVVNDENEFALLREKWEALLNNSSNMSIYLTYQWIYTWWQHFSKNVGLNLVVFEEGDTMLPSVDTSIV